MTFISLLSIVLFTGCQLFTTNMDEFHDLYGRVVLIRDLETGENSDHRVEAGNKITLTAAYTSYELNLTVKNPQNTTYELTIEKDKNKSDPGIPDVEYPAGPTKAGSFTVTIPLPSNVFYYYYTIHVRDPKGRRTFQKYRFSLHNEGEFETPDISLPAAPKTYTVVFEKNGGITNAVPRKKTVTTPATTIDALPIPPIRVGYTFTGWNRTPDGTDFQFTSATEVNKDMIVFAQWERNGSGDPAPEPPKEASVWQGGDGQHKTDYEKLGDAIAAAQAGDVVHILLPTANVQAICTRPLAYALDCSVRVSRPLGNFAGTLDGGGQTIELDMDCQATGNVGLFGELTGAGVKNLKLIGTLVALATDSSKHNQVGALAGRMSGSAIVDCVSFDGTVVSNEVIGGLVGAASGGTISNCYTAGTVKQEGWRESRYVGGVAGISTGTISYCYSTMLLSVSDDGQSNLRNMGGIAAVSSMDNTGTGTIQNCVALTSMFISAADNTTNGRTAYIGRIAGNGQTVSACYATKNMPYQTINSVPPYTWAPARTSGIDGADIDPRTMNVTGAGWWLTDSNGPRFGATGKWKWAGDHPGFMFE